jgi:hypothetical protein
MKITFELDSENEDDMYKYKLYNNAINMSIALDKIDNLTRSWYKYSDDPNISTEKVRDEILDIINDCVPDFHNM